jgi:cobalamin biosynthesis Mg chelatase CobN
MTDENVWQGEHSVETTASAHMLWQLLSDIRGWPQWNVGIETIEIDGPFATGSVFRMKPPGQDVLTSRLSEVRVNHGFVDETAVGDLLVRVSHRIHELPNNRRRVVYAVQATGPGAAEIGPAVSADFPQVLASLRELAERS